MKLKLDRKNLVCARSWRYEDLDQESKNDLAWKISRMRMVMVVIVKEEKEEEKEAL